MFILCISIFGGRVKDSELIFFPFRESVINFWILSHWTTHHYIGSSLSPLDHPSLHRVVSLLPSGSVFRFFRRTRRSGCLAGFRAVVRVWCANSTLSVPGSRFG